MAHTFCASHNHIFCHAQSRANFPILFIEMPWKIFSVVVQNKCTLKQKPKTKNKKTKKLNGFLYGNFNGTIIDRSEKLEGAEEIISMERSLLSLLFNNETGLFIIVIKKSQMKLSFRRQPHRVWDQYFQCNTSQK